MGDGRLGAAGLLSERRSSGCRRPAGVRTGVRALVNDEGTREQDPYRRNTHRTLTGIPLHEVTVPVIRPLQSSATAIHVPLKESSASAGA